MTVEASRPLPRRRSGHTTSVRIGSEQFHLTANRRGDGTLGEVFIHWGKPGTSAAGLLSSYAIAVSLGLRHRVPLADLIQPGLDQCFAPSGHTDDPEIPRVRSVIDYVSRRLAIDWLPYPERAALGVLTVSERVRLASAWMEPARMSNELAAGAEGEHLGRSSAASGPCRSDSSAQPCTVTASSSPGTCEALTAGRATQQAGQLGGEFGWCLEHGAD